MILRGFWITTSINHVIIGVGANSIKQKKEPNILVDLREASGVDMFELALIFTIE
jgi:hypothetical protein